MQLLYLLVGCLAWLTSATVFLTDLQPIALFSDSCTEAYSSPIVNCDGASFAPFDGDGSCPRACVNELNNLARSLQAACQLDGVKADTVIAHAFQGDLANWLCERDIYTTKVPTVVPGTATNAKATSTPAASTSSAASDDDESTSTEDTSTSTTETSTSSSASVTSTTLSVSVTATTATAQASSTTSSSPPRQTSNSIGDSTPFDQTVFANYAQPTKHDRKTLLLIEILVPTVVSSIVIGLSGWMY